MTIFFLVLIPQLAWKYDKAFRIGQKQKINAANISLRNILNKGNIAADDYESLPKFIEIREELNKLSIFDKNNRLVLPVGLFPTFRARLMVSSV